MSDFVEIGLREGGQNECTDRRLDGRLQDFVNEATQIEILRNFEQNRRLQNGRTDIRTTISASRWPQIKKFMEKGVNYPHFLFAP